MNNLAKVPFLLLLLSLLAGILIQYYFKTTVLAYAIIPLGLICIITSVFIPFLKYSEKWNWIFGAGTIFAFVGVGILTTSLSLQKTSFTFSSWPKAYRGIIDDIPTQKKRTILCPVYLPDYNKHIICYFQKNAILEDSDLTPGNEFYFYTEIVPFQNLGNPDSFDYKKYMNNKGYTGTAFVTTGKWIHSSLQYSSFSILASKCRLHLLNIYKQFGLNHDEYGLVAALTLGYQDDLSTDFKQSFRKTGTAHVLSVSGLHVGIIYMAISFILQFIPFIRKIRWLKASIIILILILYAYITGLSPPVIRAALMLIIFCISTVIRRRNFSYNTLCATAFFMLLVAPLSFFDIGFQLSFAAVFSIMFLYPKIAGLFQINSRIITKVWRLLCISLAAQIGSLPFCLYYFGSFPTYFFIANIIIVPLTGFIIYSGIGLLVVKCITPFLPSLTDYLLWLPLQILRISVKSVSASMHLIEQLPYASIENIQINFPVFIFLLITIWSLLLFCIYKNSKILIVSLTSLFIIISLQVYTNYEEAKNKLIVYNRPGETDIRWNLNNKSYAVNNLTGSSTYRLMKIENTTILILTRDIWTEKSAINKFHTDYLILANDYSYSLASLCHLFSFNKLILDSSLPASTRNRLVNESQKLEIPCHDITENGAYRINF